MRRDTRRWLSEDAGLFGQVLARMMGAWDAGEPVEAGPIKPPKPWEVCREMGLSYGALLDWVADDDQRKAKFERALEIRAHLFVEEIVDIADGTGQVGRDKLRVQTRQWIASKFNRKVYGEQNVAPVAVQINIGDAATRLAELERELGIGRVLEQPALAAIENELTQAGSGDGITPAAAGRALLQESPPVPDAAFPLGPEL